MQQRPPHILTPTHQATPCPTNALHRTLKRENGKLRGRGSTPAQLTLVRARQAQNRELAAHHRVLQATIGLVVPASDPRRQLW